MANGDNAKRPKRFKSTTSTLIICIVITLVSMLLPPLVNSIFKNAHYETAAGLGNPEWLGFWGSYLGGIFSSSAALIALYITIRQQELHHTDALTTIRLEYLPIPAIDYHFKDVSKEILLDTLLLIYEHDKSVSSQLIITEEDFRSYISKNIDTHLPIQIEISNIGNGAFLDLKILNGNGKPCELCGLAPGGKETFYFAIPITQQGIKLDLQFSDILGNIYICNQEITFDQETNQVEFHSCSAPILQKISNTFELLD